MAVRCEHFIFAYWKGIGYKLIKSSGVDELVSRQTLMYLCHIGNNLEKEARVQVWLPSENLIAICFLKPGKDEYGRRTIWNHTILIDISDYLNLNYPTFFEPYFIRKLDKPLDELDPIIIQTGKSNG